MSSREQSNDDYTCSQVGTCRTGNPDAKFINSSGAPGAERPRIDCMTSMTKALARVGIGRLLTLVAALWVSALVFQQCASQPAAEKPANTWAADMKPSLT